MADEPPKKASDRFASWKKAAQKGQVSAVGDSDDVLKKAVALNPSLKGDKSTQELMKEVDAVRKAAAGKRDAPEASDTKPKIALVSDPAALPRLDSKDLVQAIAATKQWLSTEQKRIADAQARAKSDAQALDKAQAVQLWETRDRVLALLASVDPNVLSPKTQALLETHATWLKSIGFKRDQISDRPERPS